MVKTEEFSFYRPVYRSTNASQLGIISMDLKYTISLMFTGWAVNSVNVQREDIRFTTPPGNCTNLSYNYFAMSRQGGFINVDLPQGAYFGIGIAFGLTVSVVPGGCPPSLTAEVTEGYCAGPPVSLGKVQLEAFGGAGPPYTFFYSAGNGGAYTQTTSSILELVNGTYALKVRDALGAESTPISVTVPTVSNIFRGNQVGFCSVIEPESTGITGSLQPLQEGEYRQFEVTVSQYFDFSTFPEGAIVTGKFGINCSFFYDGADDGYNSIADDCIQTQFEVREAYVLQDGVRTDFSTSSWSVSSYGVTNGTVGLNPGGGAVFGGGTLFGENFGYWSPSYSTDGCTAYTEGALATRTSPNGWFDCIYLQAYGSSFIEYDKRGMRYNNYCNLSSPTIQFTNQTRLYLKLYVKLKNNMPVYIPNILNETNDSTVQPRFYDPVAATLLNLPNESQITLGGFSTLQISHSLYNAFVTQRPPSPPCWNLNFPFGVGIFGGTFPGIGYFPNPQSPTSNGFPRLVFTVDSSQPATTQNGEVNSYNNTFVLRNNTCQSLPSWAP
jgi:hypothetical protein